MTYSPEQKKGAFNKCGVTNGRQLTIQHVVDLCSEISSLDREAQKELIRTLPAIEAKLVEAFLSFKEITSNVLQSNNDSETQVYGIYKDAIRSIDEELKNPNISEERRRELSAERKEYIQLADSKDSEGKAFKKTIMQYASYCLIGIVVPTACVIGGKIYVK